MITDEKLIELGFYKHEVGDLIYFIKGWVKLEKIFCGYLCPRPYKVISTMDELETLIYN